MNITFNDEKYKEAHLGKAPRGRRAWAFCMMTEDGELKKAVTPPGFITYTEAKAGAISILQGFEITEAVLYVAP